MNRVSPASTGKRRNAMTLVELMVAIALSAMLLGALVGVLGGLSKQTRLSENYDQAVWPARFIELLRRDVIAAEAMWSNNQTVWITADSPQYGDSGGSRQIGYRCADLSAGRAVLERIDGDRVSVIAIGPTRLSVERLDRLGFPQPLPPAPGPVPAQIRVWVWGDDDQHPVVLRDLVNR